MSEWTDGLGIEEDIAAALIWLEERPDPGVTPMPRNVALACTRALLLTAEVYDTVGAKAFGDLLERVAAQVARFVAAHG